MSNLIFRFSLNTSIWRMPKIHKRVGENIKLIIIMNLSKIELEAVKTVKEVNPSQEISIESMKKVMGGGSYGCHCCAVTQ